MTVLQTKEVNYTKVDKSDLVSYETGGYSTTYDYGNGLLHKQQKPKTEQVT